MSYSSVFGMGSEADCAQLAAQAKETTRIAQTMVRFNQMGGGDEKTAGIAKLLQSWSTGTGEPYEAMEARWRAKSNADGAGVVAARAVFAESKRVYETMVRVRLLGGSPEKTRQINQLLQSWGTPGESYAAMEARRRAKSNADGAALNAAIAAAAESNRIYQTMVRTRQMSGGDEKTRQVAQLRKTWATSTGESWGDMMARWGVKRAADAKAAAECAASGGAPAPADGGAPGGAPADGGVPPADAPAEGGVAGLPIWAWGAIGAGVLALVGGALVIRARRKKTQLAVRETR
jgi:hypothetical protein